MNLKYAKRSEDTEQIKVISWAKHNESRMPELKWLYHCPNGGSRNKAEAIKLKQMGVKPKRIFKGYGMFRVFCCYLLFSKSGNRRNRKILSIKCSRRNGD